MTQDGHKMGLQPEGCSAVMARPPPPISDGGCPNQTRGCSHAQGLGFAVRNCAPSSHPAVCNRALPLDLAVRNHAPSFFIGMTSDGWGFLVVFSILANKSCCTRQPTEKQTQAPSRAPLWRGKHAAPGGYISTATTV